MVGLAKLYEVIGPVLEQAIERVQQGATLKYIEALKNNTLIGWVINLQIPIVGVGTREAFNAIQTDPQFVVKPALGWRRRGLNNQNRQRDRFAFRIVVSRVELPESIDDHGLAIVSFTNQKQTRHAMRSWISKQVFKSIKNALGCGIADPARTAHPFDAFFITQLKHCADCGTQAVLVHNFTSEACAG